MRLRPDLARQLQFVYTYTEVAVYEGGVSDQTGIEDCAILKASTARHRRPAVDGRAVLDDRRPRRRAGMVLGRRRFEKAVQSGLVARG